MFFGNFNCNNQFPRNLEVKHREGNYLMSSNVCPAYRTLSGSRILKEFVCLTANDPMKEKRYGHLVFSYLKSCTVCIS